MCINARALPVEIIVTQWNLELSCPRTRHETVVAATLRRTLSAPFNNGTTRTGLFFSVDSHMELVICMIGEIYSEDIVRCSGVRDVTLCIQNKNGKTTK